MLSLPAWLPCTFGATLVADALQGWREEGEAVQAAFAGLCGLCLWGVVVGLIWALPAYALPALAVGWLRARGSWSRDTGPRASTFRPGPGSRRQWPRSKVQPARPMLR